jgi:hemerythrin superfamily protein
LRRSDIPVDIKKDFAMRAVMSNISPSITTMIRMDHTKALATFHKFRPSSAPRVKQALVNIVCRSLEIHAQLEEEIFYPAMREVDAAIVQKNVPEHDEMRRMISSLRNMQPQNAHYDTTFMQLMRAVMHHVADEETTLLPDAERLLAGQLSELGVRFATRKLQLSAPHAGEVAADSVRAMPASTALGSAGALLLGGLLVRHFMQKRSPRRFLQGV